MTAPASGSDLVPSRRELPADGDAPVAVAGGCGGDSSENDAGNKSAAKPDELVLAFHGSERHFDR